MDKIILLLGCVAEICIAYDFFCGFFHLRDSFRALWKRVLMLFFLVMCQFCVNLLGNYYLNLVSFGLVIWGVLHDALPRAGGDEGSVLHCYFFCYGGL